MAVTDLKQLNRYHTRKERNHCSMWSSDYGWWIECQLPDGCLWQEKK